MTTIAVTQTGRARLVLLVVGVVAALWALSSAIFAVVQAITEAASGILRDAPFSRLISRQLFAAAAALLAIAGAFRYGERLQRETEGLV